MPRLIVCEPHRLVYVPVPKCASTTMHQFMASLGGIADRGHPRDCLPVKRGPVAPGAGGSYSVICSDEELSRIAEQFADFVWFSVVRDPYSRVLSNYRNKLNRYARRFEPANYALAYARQVLEPRHLFRRRHQDERIELMQSSIPFVRFVEALGRHGVDWDLHYRPQSQLLCMERVTYHRLVRMERLEEGLQSVLAAGNGRATPASALSRLNESGTHDGATPWTPATRTIVASLYGCDFETLGYAA
jgi:hypothetical protein